jgi:hypothetical protein
MLSKMHLGIEMVDEKKTKQNKAPKKRKLLGVLDPIG